VSKIIINFNVSFFRLGNSLSDDENYDESCRGSAKLKKHDPPLLFDLVTFLRTVKMHKLHHLSRFIEFLLTTFCPIIFHQT